MNAALPRSALIDDDDPAADLQRRVQQIAQLESIVAGWDSGPASTVQALKSSIEDLNKEALRRLIRALKDDEAAGAKLRAALADPLVYAVLRFHGLVRASLQERVEQALDEVRPFMAEHGGNVELVAVVPPDRVELRLLGSCHGCPASSQTLTEGVERAIRAHCPDVQHIVQVSRSAPEPAAAAHGEQVVHFVSPFARHAATRDAGWLDAGLSLDEVPEGAVVERKIGTRSVLLSRHHGSVVSCFDNACAHLGMPLDMAEVTHGVITCAYHGFQYLLESGECLTAPEVQLKVHAVRVLGTRVQVKLEG